MRSHSHLGIGFELWSNQRVWFWSAVNPCGNAGAIGAATAEAEAVREACAAIEELSALRRSARPARTRPKHLSVRPTSTKFDCLGRGRWVGSWLAAPNGSQLLPIAWQLACNVCAAVLILRQPDGTHRLYPGG